MNEEPIKQISTDEVVLLVRAKVTDAEYTEKKEVPVCPIDPAELSQCDSCQ